MKAKQDRGDFVDIPALECTPKIGEYSVPDPEQCDKAARQYDFVTNIFLAFMTSYLNASAVLQVRHQRPADGADLPGRAGVRYPGQGAVRIYR